ncbi:MAG: MATE family efflux transporter, partial [Lachnospiraceae bacterium]|nr:MATE family efflux transporter [Lachnospiraceae bacterium]
MQLDMTKGNPLKNILIFTLPLLIGNLFQQFYNMADTLIVGRFVGENALAAVGSTGTIMFLILGFSIGISTGFTVLTAQAFGAHDIAHVRQTVANALILSGIVIIITTVISNVFMHPILHLMNTPENIYDDAYTYINIIATGLAASVLYNLSSAILRAVGNSIIPLVSLVFSACLNVVLDLVFIAKFKMGVAGAARATVISQGLSAVLCFIYIFVKLHEIWPKKENIRLDLRDAQKQLSVGIPMSLQFAITASGTMIMQSAINLFGSKAVAAITAASKLHNIITQGMVSAGQTMTTYCAQNYGVGDSKRIKEGVNSAFRALVIYSLVAAAIGLLLLTPSLHLFFTDDGTEFSELLPLAKTYMYACVIFYIPLSMIFLFRNAMEGCGYGFLPMIGGVVELLSRAAA